MALPETQPRRTLQWSRGERMAKAREGVDLTQIEMAAELTRRGRKCEDSTVSAWEGMRNQPKKMMDLLKLWSDITGIPVSELLGDEISSYRDPPTLTLINGETTDDRRHLRLVHLPPPGMPERRRFPVAAVATGV